MNQIRIGAILSYLSIFLTFVVGILYTPILIRILGQTDYGLYSLILSVASYLSLLDMGVGNAVVRYIARNKAIGNKKNESELIGQFVKFFLYIGILTLFIGTILSINIHAIFQNSLDNSDIKTAQIMVLILTVNFAISFPLNVFSAVLQAYEKFIFLKVCSITRIILLPILTLIILFIGGHLIAITIITSFLNVAILFVGFVYCRKSLGVKLSFTPIEKDLKKDIYIYSFFVFITAIADKVYWQTDQILLGIFKSTEDVAVYAVSVQFILIFMSLSTAISGLFLPKLSKIVTESNHILRLNTFFIEISRIQIIILALAFSGFIIFGKEFIVLWAGPSYELAYIIIIIIMIPLFIDLIQNVGRVILQAKGLHHFRTISLIICSMLNIIVSIPVIIYYGSIGTAIVTSIFVAIGNVLLLNIYFHFKVGLNMKLYWTNISNIIIPIAILVIVFCPLKNNFQLKPIELLISMLVYTLVYLVVIYFCSLNGNEKQYIKNSYNYIIKKLNK